MLDQEFSLQGFRMIEVDLCALGGWQVGQIPIIGVMGQVGDAVRADFIQDHVRDCGLSGAGAAGDANDEGGFRWGHGKIIIRFPAIS